MRTIHVVPQSIERLRLCPTVPQVLRDVVDGEVPVRLIVEVGGDVGRQVRFWLGDCSLNSMCIAKESGENVHCDRALGIMSE